MTFITPSTASSPVLPYAYGSLIPNTWFDYIDDNFSSCLDAVHGGTYHPTSAINLVGTSPGSAVLTITDGYVNFNAGSVLTINQSDILNAFGPVNFGAFTVFSAPSGVNFSSATTILGIGINTSTTAASGADIIIGAQDTTAASSTGGDVVLNSGTGLVADGNVILQVGGTTCLTISRPSFGLAHITTSSNATLTLPDGTLNITNGFVNMDATSTFICDGGIETGGSGQFIVNNGTFFTANSGSISTFNGQTSINNGLGATTGSTFNFSSTIVPITDLTGATDTILTPTQYANPNLIITASGSITGSLNIRFPAVDGTWIVNLGQLQSGSHVNGQIVAVKCGSNIVQVYIGGGGAGGNFVKSGCQIVVVTVASGVIYIG